MISATFRRCLTPACLALAVLGCKARGTPEGAASGVKVVGGTAVADDGYDFVVGLAEEKDGGWEVYCTGTVIGPKVVVTAAHCLEDLSKTKVMVGNDVKQADAVTFYEIERAGKHKEFAEEPELKNDVAYLVLKEALPERIKPVPLFTSGFKLGRFLQDNKADEREVVEVVGYGRTSADSVVTGVKHRATTVIDGATALSFDQLILGSADRDACKGDSGGPVFITYNDTRYLAATISGATDFILGEGGRKIWMICKGKTRAMRLAAYWQWLADETGLTFPRIP